MTHWPKSSTPPTLLITHTKILVLTQDTHWERFFLPLFVTQKSVEQSKGILKELKWLHAPSIKQYINLSSRHGTRLHNANKADLCFLDVALSHHRILKHIMEQSHVLTNAPDMVKSIVWPNIFYSPAITMTAPIPLVPSSPVSTEDGGCPSRGAKHMKWQMVSWLNLIYLVLLINTCNKTDNTSSPSPHKIFLCLELSLINSSSVCTMFVVVSDVTGLLWGTLLVAQALD